MLTAPALAAALLASPPTSDLSAHFGFDPLEVQKIDAKAGPMIAVDLNGDGLKDLVVVNNRKSRIELYYQRADAKPGDEKPPTPGSNELPELWRFRREVISVPHEILAVLPTDFDHDGKMDLIYAGQPGTIAFVKQSKPGVFEIVHKVPVKNLVGNRDNLLLANVMGDAKPELITNTGGKISVWPLDNDQVGTPLELSAGEGSIVAIMADDFDGNGTTDLAGVVPEDSSPIRIWLTSVDGDKLVIGPQNRFEMPPLREAECLHLPGDKQAQLAVIEKPSKRIVFSKLAKSAIKRAGDREASIQTVTFNDPQNKKRNFAVADIDGDGRLDLLATNTGENAVMLYRQKPGKGFETPEKFPALSDLDSIAAQSAKGDQRALVFLLSEKEGIVGRSDAGTDGISFPKAIPLPAGSSPVTMNLVDFNGAATLAVVTKDGRNYTLQLIPVTGDQSMDPKNHRSVSLGTLSRGPETILSVDADHDGHTDLLVFTPDKPMIMVRDVMDKDGKAELKVFESKDMGQFGLVQAANGRNTAALDLLGDGKSELLVADRNYVRALTYNPAPPAGTSPGWQVVKQINAEASDAKLTCIALMGDKIVAGDRENGRLVVFSKNDKKEWKQSEAIEVPGFKFNQIFAGPLGGDDNDVVLVIGDSSFAVVRLQGERWRLEEVASWKSDEPRRVEHELVVGDINGDGFLDVTALDASDQMAEILTFSQSGKVHYGTAFEVFESKMFSGGEPKEFEPNMGVVADVTGDGKDDLILLAHDRVLIYPQQTKPEGASAKK
ncbi:MAG: VCBS repeat-containing protein [Planctomycetes bacterium]|nr:VCBS repeat-containing protein [Planctomycetota bacterium]